jgi:hypothetical protein
VIGRELWVLSGPLACQAERVLERVPDATPDYRRRQTPVRIAHPSLARPMGLAAVNAGEIRF